MLSYKNVSFGLAGIILGAVAVSTMQYVTAWTAPTFPPPGGNVAAPLTTGNLPQTRSGNLNLSGSASLIAGGDVGARNIIASQRVSTNNELCIGGDCRTAWPTNVTGGNCASGQVVQSISSAGVVTCAVDQGRIGIPGAQCRTIQGWQCPAEHYATGLFEAHMGKMGNVRRITCCPL